MGSSLHVQLEGCTFQLAWVDSIRLPSRAGVNFPLPLPHTPSSAELFDGRGTLATVRIAALEKQCLEVELVEDSKTVPRSGPQWTVAAACNSLKGGRADWLIEKCTVCGTEYPDMQPLCSLWASWWASRGSHRLHPGIRSSGSPWISQLHATVDLRLNFLCWAPSVEVDSPSIPFPHPSSMLAFHPSAPIALYPSHPPPLPVFLSFPSL